MKQYLGTAVSCLLALSLVTVASCAPLCGGAACLPQKTSESQASCHGMTDHGDSPSSFAAQVSACQLGDAVVAVIGKSGLGVHPVSYVAGILVTEDAVQHLAASHSETPLFDSSPGNSLSRVTILVLRV